MPRINTKQAELEVLPLSTDPRVAQAQARVDALQQRRDFVRARRFGSHGADDVSRLLRDPRAVMTPAVDVRALELELQTLDRAIESAEADVDRARGVVSLERAREMRLAEVAEDRELETILRRARETITAHVLRRARLNAAGYSWQSVLPQYAYPDDRDAIERL